MARKQPWPEPEPLRGELRAALLEHLTDPDIWLAPPLPSGVLDEDLRGTAERIALEFGPLVPGGSRERADGGEGGGPDDDWAGQTQRLFALIWADVAASRPLQASDAGPAQPRRAPPRLTPEQALDLARFLVGVQRVAARRAGRRESARLHLEIADANPEERERERDEARTAAYGWLALPNGSAARVRYWVGPDGGRPQGEAAAVAAFVVDDYLRFRGWPGADRAAAVLACLRAARLSDVGKGCAAEKPCQRLVSQGRSLLVAQGCIAK